MDKYKRVEATCKLCGTTFMARVDKIADGCGKFCSRDCVHASIRLPKQSRNDSVRRWKNLVKQQAMARYGGAKCACCGETGIEFLTFDHINGDGAEHRKQIGSKGRRLFLWLKKNGYPDGYRILCYNCNIASYWNNGICPHQLQKSAT